MFFETDPKIEAIAFENIQFQMFALLFRCLEINDDKRITQFEPDVNLFNERYQYQKNNCICGKDCANEYLGTVNLIITENMIKTLSQFTPDIQTWITIIDQQAEVCQKISFYEFPLNQKL